MRRIVRKGETVLRAVRPNAGLEAAFRRRLWRLIDEMNASVLYWVKARYRADPPVMAQDAKTPASQLRIAMNKLARRWQSQFDDASRDMATYFAADARRRSDDVLRRILKRSGFTVEFKMTPAMDDVLKATIAEQVALIKSIPQRYLLDVQGAVMRSVQAGRDLGSLTDEIEEKYGVARRRAAFIALDQNNKATANMVRVRQVELGINEAVWLHSHAGKVPRKTHLANDGKRYDPARGWFDPDPKVRRLIFPGELPRCRCNSRSVIKGFS